MKRIAPVLLLFVLAPARAETPPEARALIDAYRADETKVMLRFDEEMAPRRQELLDDLEQLKKKLAGQDKLDEAVVVRELIGRLRVEFKLRGAQVRSDPGSLTVLMEADPSRPYYFEVTGSTAGSVWGTDVYTLDSSLATAAVHAGALREGATGIVEVTLLPGRQDYEGSERNGVTSNSWGAYEASYGVEAVSTD